MPLVHSLFTSGSVSQIISEAGIDLNNQSIVMTSFDLILDPQIRNWVLLPVVAVMLLVGVGRSLAQQLMRSDNQSDLEVIRHRQLLSRASRLRRLGGLLRPGSFAMRKVCFCCLVFGFNKCARNILSGRRVANCVRKSKVVQQIPWKIQVG